MELDQLISYLINKEDSEGVVLLGHSTGCQVNDFFFQTSIASESPLHKFYEGIKLITFLYDEKTKIKDIVHYMRTNAACSRAVRAAILQVLSNQMEVLILYLV